MGARRGRPYRALAPRTRRAVQTVVKSTLNRQSEWKHFTQHFTDTASTAGLIRDMSPVTQGDTDITRDGDALHASSLEWRGHCFSADANNIVRLIFFQWYPATTPVVTDILNNVASGDVTSLYETDKAAQYKILMDRSWALDVFQTGGALRTSFMRKKIRIPRPKMQFLAGSTNGTNKVYMLLISDSGAVSHPGVRYTAKLNFRDN